MAQTKLRLAQVVTSSSPGISASILATNSSGYIRIASLGIGDLPTFGDAALTINNTISGSSYVFGQTIEGNYTSSSENAFSYWMQPTLTPGNGKKAIGFYSNAVINANVGRTIEAYGGLIAALTKTGAGAVSTAYGLKIDNVTIGSTNYGIYTGQGLNYHGDQLSVVGSQDLIQLAVTGYLNQTYPISRLMVNNTTNNAVLEALRLEAHVSGGSSLAGYGVSQTFYAEDAGGSYVQQSGIESVWTTATHATRNARIDICTFPKGSASPIGKCAFWSSSDMSSAETIIANGTGDVTEVISILYSCAEITGTDTGGGVCVLEPGDSYNILSDGTNTLTITCVADGSVTIARSAGTDTYKVSLWMSWI